GGKAKALATLSDFDFPVPSWMVVTPNAFYDSLSEAQKRHLTLARNAAEIAQVLDSLALSSAVDVQIRQALSQMCPNGERVAVRSSALDEDGAQHSFAGQLESFLFVAHKDVAEKVIAVWRSGFSERILAYRAQQHANSLDNLPQAPAVLIQQMVNAELSGVAFSADPVSGQRGVCVIGAVHGLGTSLVSGEADADTYHIDRTGVVINRQIVPKQIAHRFDLNQAAGVKAASVSPQISDQSTLSDAQIDAITDLARRAEQVFDRPQDIEWAIEDDRLYLLQSRPITTLSNVADPDGVFTLWDNSNIAESYPGITTPLTFSFALPAYEAVYRQFCLMMGVPMHIIAAHDHTFQRMLGLINGRIYYNLLNWYQMLALLPGFKINRQFMEQMMGVKEGLPAYLVADIDTSTRREKLRDTIHFIKSVFGLVRNFRQLPRQKSEFYTRLDQALGTERPNLDGLRIDELVTHYRHLERDLLTQWDAPLTNDFFAMIFYGLLRKITEAWCHDQNGTLQNKLVSGTGGMISTEPARRVREMAHLVAQDTAFVDTLCMGTLVKIKQQMVHRPAFHQQYQAYLDKFGDRCLEELKLESLSLFDDPLVLLRAIGQVARHFDYSKRAVTQPDMMSQTAEEQVYHHLKSRPIRRLIFKWVLRHARHLVRDRENLRFERTRVFGRARLIMSQLGRRLYALDKLTKPRDIFYLEVDEVLGFVEGTATCIDLRGLVTLRKAEFERYKQLPAPTERFETYGAVYQGNEFQTERKASIQTSGYQQQGIGCSPGIVRGQVRIVRDPKHAVVEPGQILVAERTDPGWIMLFAAASGLLVEHGSLLSHAAIVSREMGIPGVIGLAGITSWLEDGEWVELNGNTGEVTKIVPQLEKQAVTV
ncbi:MAG: PEP/pyruvate-binding domain-containing protein, partial [Chloroflexota bacterium]